MATKKEMANELQEEYDIEVDDIEDETHSGLKKRLKKQRKLKKFKKQMGDTNVDLDEEDIDLETLEEKIEKVQADQSKQKTDKAKVKVVQPAFVKGEHFDKGEIIKVEPDFAKRVLEENDNQLEVVYLPK